MKFHNFEHLQAGDPQVCAKCGGKPLAIQHVNWGGSSVEEVLNDLRQRRDCFSDAINALEKLTSESPSGD